MAKINPALGAGAAILGAASWFQPAVAGSDLWWHLASGRDIWRTGSIPNVDPYSYTFGGETWMNHEWLWDVLYWAVYRLGPEAVAWTNLAVLVAIYSLVFALAHRETGSRLAAGAVTWAAAASAHWFLDIRPHLFTLLLVAWVLRTREWRFAVWMWPPLVAVWANLHGGFVFGVCTIGLLVCVRTVEQSLPLRRLVLPRAEWISIALCGVAILATPWGYHILEYPMEYLDQASPYRGIIEWQAPAFSLDPTRFEGRFWLFAALTAAGIPFAWRRSPFLVLLALVTFEMAWTSRRFIPLFGVTAAPVAAAGLAALLRAMRARAAGLGRAQVELAFGLAALGVAGLLWRDVRIYPQLLERWTQTDLYPDAAVRYLNALGPPRRLLNHYNWGGYLMLHAPETRLFIDGRANTLYDDRIYLDYLGLLGARPGLQARLARYRPEAALLPNRPLARAMLALPEPWIQVFRGPAGLILLPPGSPLLDRPLPDLDEVLHGHPGLDLIRAGTAQRRGALDAAERHLEAAREVTPLTPSIYGALARLRARRGDIEGVAREIDRGVAAYPRRCEELRAIQASIYMSLNRPDLALKAFERSIPKGPFRRPGATIAQIERLRATLGR